MRYDLDDWLAAYIEAARIGQDLKTSPLFRAGQSRRSLLTDRAMSPHAVRRMLKRRLHGTRNIVERISV